MIAPTIDTLELLDFTPALPCDDRRLHALGMAYHTADAPGEYHMIAPCCGSRAVVCRSRVEYLTGPTCATIRCTRCDLDHAPHTYRFELVSC